MDPAIIDGVDEPHVHYADSRGVSIASQATGLGDADLLLARRPPGPVDHAAAHRRLREAARLAGAAHDATVKTHIARIFAKLGLHDRAQAVVLAYESGLVQPGAAPA
jgi:hypothetical protein